VRGALTTGNNVQYGFAEANDQQKRPTKTPKP